MKYKSTRGVVTGLSFEEALFSGFLSDGGIVMPHSIPQISRLTLGSWSDKSYIELAKVVLPYFIPTTEIPSSDLDFLLDRAFSRFTHPDTAPLVRLPSGLAIMELFHGVTWSFKDLALSCVGQFLEYFLDRKKEHITVVVATSGDTGSAAIEAVRGLRWVDIVCMFPRNRLSEVQEKQMTSVDDVNVKVIKVSGSVDDCDNVIKPCFLDESFAEKHKLCSINSINWSRLMVQTVHYFYLYLQMCPACDQEVEVIIPTGACGNVTAGVLAHEMGLPLKLSCAVTRNNIVDRTVKDGDFSAAEEVLATLAPAMDIQVPYNMERIWYLVTGGDCERVAGLMEQFEIEKRLRVPEDIKALVSERIASSSTVADDGVTETIRRVHAENDGYWVCPHTAIGVHHYFHKTATASLRAVLATASVCKFEEAVKAAGMTLARNTAVSELLGSPVHCVELQVEDDWEHFLRNTIETIWERNNLQMQSLPVNVIGSF